MRRSLLTILIVAAISGWISRGERAAGLSADRTMWIRTADGWEPRRALADDAPATRAVPHPAIVATFQLVASLYFLGAFPARVAVPATQAVNSARPERRRADRRAAAVG